MRWQPRLLEHNGKRLTVREWAKELGIPKPTLDRRLKMGLDPFVSHVRKRSGHFERPEYKVWSAMVQRCSNPKNARYAEYGGRGIQVCPRWREFSAFFEDMGPRPHPRASIDRINNDLGYSPDNCRWADARTQSRNRPGYVRMITHAGKTMHISDWSKAKGIPLATLRERLDRGWSIKDALEGRPQVPGEWSPKRGHRRKKPKKK